MVWQSSQSALYKAVAEYNRGEFSKDNFRNCTEKAPENNVQCSDNAENSFCRGNIAEKPRENCAGNCEKKRSVNRKVNNPTQNCVGNCKKCCKKQRGNNPLSELFADGDFLMIAALIFILYKNGADQKLIIALVFVLLG